MSTRRSSRQRYSMTRLELVFITHDLLTDIWRFDRQPTTEDIVVYSSAGDTHVIQLIGDQYNVYDLTTLRLTGTFWTIGIPVFVTEDYDAAIMWAMLNGGKR
jgi:hypothetical protein